nr:hypothetical protein K-LCC10_0324 [Kaumoebavirus]
MADELDNIMKAISTESLIAELMRRHYREPIKKSDEEIKDEEEEFLLANHTDKELHAMREHPKWKYLTIEASGDESWEDARPKDSWILNEEYMGGEWDEGNGTVSYFLRKPRKVRDGGYTDEQLHSMRMHPDWHYHTFRVVRKGLFYHNPEDDGWIRNMHYCDGFYRDLDTDSYYYMRLKK